MNLLGSLRVSDVVSCQPVNNQQKRGNLDLIFLIAFYKSQTSTLDAHEKFILCNYRVFPILVFNLAEVDELN